MEGQEVFDTTLSSFGSLYDQVINVSRGGSYELRVYPSGESVGVYSFRLLPPEPRVAVGPTSRNVPLGGAAVFSIEVLPSPTP